MIRYDADEIQDKSLEGQALRNSFSRKPATRVRVTLARWILQWTALMVEMLVAAIEYRSILEIIDVTASEHNGPRIQE